MKIFYRVEQLKRSVKMGLAIAGRTEQDIETTIVSITDFPFDFVESGKELELTTR